MRSRGEKIKIKSKGKKGKKKGKKRRKKKRRENRPLTDYGGLQRPRAARAGKRHPVTGPTGCIAASRNRWFWLRHVTTSFSFSLRLPLALALTQTEGTLHSFLTIIFPYPLVCGVCVCACVVLCRYWTIQYNTVQYNPIQGQTTSSPFTKLDRRPLLSRWNPEEPALVAAALHAMLLGRRPRRLHPRSCRLSDGPPASRRRAVALWQTGCQPPGVIPPRSSP